MLCFVQEKCTIKELNFTKIAKTVICIDKQVVSELAQLIFISHNNSFFCKKSRDVRENTIDSRLQLQDMHC